MLELPSWITYCFFFIEFFVSFSFLVFYAKFKLRNKALAELKSFPEITFIIPAYNCGHIIGDTIRSIKSLDYEQDKINIFIIDDASTDNTLDVSAELAKRYSGIKVFTKKHSGKAATLNAGIKKASTEFVCILDSDTILNQDVLKKAMIAFQKESVVGVTARLKALNNKKFIERMQNVEYAITGFYRDIMGKASSLPLTPAFSVFRRKFFERHGYFDVDNLTEDFEMGLRIQKEHYDIAYVADSYALTEVPNTFKRFMRQRIRWVYGTLFNYRKYKELFFRKEYGDLGFFILPVWFLGMLIASFVFLMGVYTLATSAWDFAERIFVGWRPYFLIDTGKIFFFLIDLRILLLIFSLLLGLLLFFFVRYDLKENIKLKDYILFILVYFWMLALTSAISLGYFLIRKKPNW